MRFRLFQLDLEKGDCAYEISLENGNSFKPNYYSTSIDVYIVAVYCIACSITYKKRLPFESLFFSGDIYKVPNPNRPRRVLTIQTMRKRWKVWHLL